MLRLIYTLTQTPDIPKSFLFTGWHPHCRCHVIAITATQEKSIKHEQKLLRREYSTLKYKNTIDKVPGSYTEWIKKEKSISYTCELFGCSRQVYYRRSKECIVLNNRYRLLVQI